MKIENAAYNDTSSLFPCLIINTFTKFEHTYIKLHSIEFLLMDADIFHVCYKLDSV